MLNEYMPCVLVVGYPDNTYTNFVPHRSINCKLHHEWTQCVHADYSIEWEKKKTISTSAATTYSLLIVHLMLLFLFMFVQKLYFNSIMFNVHLNTKWILRPTISHLLFLRINAGARFINKEERLPIIDCYYFGNRSIHCCCCCCSCCFFSFIFGTFLSIDGSKLLKINI